jgi:hypothetical protein
VHQRGVGALVGGDRGERVAEPAGVDQLLDLRQRLEDGRVGPGVRLAVEHRLEDLGAADAIGEVLDPHELGPNALPGQRERDDAGVAERRDGVEGLLPGGRHLDAGLREDVLVVVQDDRLDVVHRDRVGGAVDDAVLGDRRHDAADELFRLGGDVVDLVVGDVVGERAAGPVHDQRRRLARAHRRADLLLEGVVLELLDRDRLVGVALVPALERGGRDRPAAAGEDPRAGLAAGGAVAVAVAVAAVTGAAAARAAVGRVAGARAPARCQCECRGGRECRGRHGPESGVPHCPIPSLVSSLVSKQLRRCFGSRDSNAAVWGRQSGKSHGLTTASEAK